MSSEIRRPAPAFSDSYRDRLRQGVWASRSARAPLVLDSCLRLGAACQECGRIREERRVTPQRRFTPEDGQCSNRLSARQPRQQKSRALRAITLTRLGSRAARSSPEARALSAA